MRGLYTVRLHDGEHPAKARGLFRETDTAPVVGDRVRVRMAPDGDIAYIEEVLPRDNLLLRPPVANVDRALIVMSQKEPDIHLALLDRFLVMCEQAELPALLCLNKSDIADEAALAELASVYRNIGYPVFITSAQTGQGVEALREEVAHGTTALGGPSGVGKSSLLTALFPGLALETGSISAKTRRGRHTTRHVEIFPVGPDAYVLDTPGFSNLELRFLEKAEELAALFPEFPVGQCRFDDCRHIREPGCAVKEMADTGEIATHRYANYLLFMEELADRKEY